MEFLKYFYIAILSMFFFLILIFAIKSKSLLKTISINAVAGILSLIVINLISKYTGVFIPINWYSVIASIAFGLPATGGLLILPLIFFK